VDLHGNAMRNREENGAKRAGSVCSGQTTRALETEKQFGVLCRPEHNPTAEQHVYKERATKHP
jgi:hypothetical protein